MKRNNFFSRFIVVTLTAALLLVSGSRAIRVLALADPVPITAVYDTQIIQLADYVDSLPQPSVDIFYILCGVLAAAQLGGQEYKLEDPYATSSDVIDWFKSMGIRLYNTVIGLAPNRDPILGFDVRPYVKPLIAAMMGNAVLSRNYGSVQDFLDSDDDVLVPFQADIQHSINLIWQIQGGPFEWQFDTQPFTSDIVYVESSSQTLSNQVDEYMRMYDHVYRANNTVSSYNFSSALIQFADIDISLFLDRSIGQAYFVDTSGNRLSRLSRSGKHYAFVYGNSAYTDSFPNNVNASYWCPDEFELYSYNIDFDSVLLPQVINIFNSDRALHSRGFAIIPQDFIKHVYEGTNWINKHEIFNVQDLNINDDGNEYFYNEVQDDILIDIKNLINDLVDTTDIWNNIINNVYNPDGTQILNLPTIRVSVDLTPITELLDPPVPVNLNDIAELTDNTYLERVKEHARNAGDIFANYVAFWHNCDSDLVYTMFGAAILVLVGAFVGKWGHS